MNILLVSHQLDYSGAPIALLRLAETLIEQGHFLSLASMQDGPLATEFIKLGTRQFNPSFASQYDIYFANTFFSIPLALKLSPNSDKVIAWIHESRNFFSMFGIDEQLYGLNQIKRAIFPSNFMLDEYRDLMPLAELSQLRNLVSMDGITRTDNHKDHIAVTGNWQPIKNQAQLIELCKQSKMNLCFNFIGAKKPLDVSDDNHNFFGQVPQIEAQKIIAGSQGLISAAQSETQNLTAIEAILIGKPIMLSNIPAHQELKKLAPNIPLFEATDPTSFVNGLEQYQELRLNTKKLGENMKLIQEIFSKAEFDKAVRNLLT